jgi:ABC-type glycerol-3-phosphate transport system substrate-binding protein
MVSRRRLLQIGVSVPLASWLLEACSSSSQPSSGASNGPENFKGVTLQVDTRDGGGLDPKAPGIKAAIDSWSKRTGGNVQFTIIGFTDVPIKYAGYIAAQDSSVDVLYAADPFVGQFQDKLYLDITHQVGNTSVFLPATIQALTRNGHLYALPVHSEMEFFIYNKQYFQEAGLNPDQPPNTWEELFAATPKLKKGNRTANATPLLAPNEAIFYFAIIMNSTPTKLISPDGRKLQVGGSDGLSAFQTWYDGVVKHQFFDSSVLTDPGSEYDTGKIFNQGNTASMLNFSELYEDAINPGAPGGAQVPSTVADHVGAVIMPGIKAGTSGSCNGFEGFGVNRFSTHQAAALSFVREITSREPEKIMNLTKQFPSSRKDVLSDPEVLAVYPIAAVLAKQGQYNIDRYGAPYFTQLEQVLSQTLTGLWKGTYSPAQAQEQVQTQGQAAIDKFYSGS